MKSTLNFKKLLLLVVLIIGSINIYAGKKIVVLGSSTAAGAGVSSPDSAWVARYLNYIKQLDPTNTIVNLAKGGYTTFAIMPTGTPPYQAGSNTLSPDPERNITKALSLNPNAIIINMPTNDVSNGIPVEQQLENFATIINLAHENGIPVWITTSQPHNYGETYSGPYKETNQPDPYKQSARDKFKELTQRILSIYGNFAIDFYTDIATTDGYSFIRPEFDSGDGVHLNDAGHKILFTKVKEKNIIETISATVNSEVTSIPIFVNFGSEAKHPKWNDFIIQSAGSGLDALKDTTSANTSISLYLQTGFTHINATSGSESNIMEMTHAISKSNLCSNGANPILIFSGLAVGTPYSFKIFGSRASVSDNRTTVYTLSGINQKKDSLNVSLNATHFVSIDSIYPTVNGQINLTISKGVDNTSGFCYINALHLQACIQEEIPFNGCINLPTAGTLSEYLPANTDTITTLTVSGLLNGSDIKVLRELPALKHLDLQNSNIVAGGVAYYNGLSTRNNVFPQEMFYNNTVLKTIILPSTIIEIPYHTFMGCTALEKVVVPQTVTVFGNDLFSGCINLIEINLPSSMTTLGTAIFYNCKKLTAITLPTGISTIPGSMFYNCNALKTIDIPEGVTTIGQWSFSYCYALETLVLPASLSSITENTFYNCTGLRNITCKALSIPTCASNPFGGSTPTTLKNYATLYVPSSSLSLYSNDPVWGQMKNIYPLISTSTINPNFLPTKKIYTANGFIIINVSDNCTLPIFNIQGKLVRTLRLQQGINYISGLQKGIYIINNRKIIL
jgi:lysophospholipase L1-like esterase